MVHHTVFKASPEPHGVQGEEIIKKRSILGVHHSSPKTR